MHRIAAIVTCVAAIALAGSPLGAQEAGRRQGFWWGLGVSYGWVHASCDICASDRDWAISATGGLGGTVSRNLLLGAELNGWTRSEEAVDEYLGAVSAVAYWFPNRGGPLYLKGGLGYVAYRIDDEESALTSSGFGPQVGAGYEVPVSRHASLFPYLNLIITIPRGNLTFNGDRQAGRASVSLFQFGLGLTWH